MREDVIAMPSFNYLLNCSTKIPPYRVLRSLNRRDQRPKLSKTLYTSVIQNIKSDDFLIVYLEYYYFKLNTAAFKAYCAIWIRRSNFRHQASPRVSPSESTQRRKVKL